MMVTSQIHVFIPNDKLMTTLILWKVKNILANTKGETHTSWHATIRGVAKCMDMKSMKTRLESSNATSYSCGTWNIKINKLNEI